LAENDKKNFPNLKKFAQLAKVFLPNTDLDPFYQLILKVNARASASASVSAKASGGGSGSV
jgi:hypothetical protein